MMVEPWNRPYQCDRWVVTTSYRGKSLLRRRPVFEAEAIGYRDDEQWVRYSDVWSTGFRGATREEAEGKVRAQICSAIQEYATWLDQRGFESKTFKMTEVCP